MSERIRVARVALAFGGVIVGRVLRWLGLRRPAVATALPDVSLPAPTAPAPAPRRDMAKGETGEFYFRETILEQLDRYQKVMRRLKSRDRDAYRMAVETGARIIPRSTLSSWQATEVSPWFADKLPSFGAICTGANSSFDGVRERKGSDELSIHYACFSKYERKRAPAAFQVPLGGVPYLLRVWFDNLADNAATNKDVYAEVPVAVMPGGEVRALRVRSVSYVSVRARQGKYRGQTFTIPQRRLDFTETCHRWAAYHHEATDRYVAQIFCGIAQLHELAHSAMTKVRCTRNGVTAAFGVQIERTPYFFRDREATTLVNGKRKKIFHIARSHTRTLNNGRIVGVRTHFRGEREFDWNGYRVQISVPGWHHLDVAEINIGAVDEFAVATDDAKELVDAADVIRRIETTPAEPRKGLHHAA